VTEQAELLSELDVGMHLDEPTAGHVSMSVGYRHVFKGRGLRSYLQGGLGGGGLYSAEEDTFCGLLYGGGGVLLPVAQNLALRLGARMMYRHYEGGSTYLDVYFGWLNIEGYVRPRARRWEQDQH